MSDRYVIDAMGGFLEPVPELKPIRTDRQGNDSLAADLREHLRITYANMPPGELRNARWVMNPEWLNECRELGVHWPGTGSLTLTIYGLPVETRDDGGCPHLEPAPAPVRFAPGTRKP